MNTVFMISYLNMNQEITHFDYRAFESHRKASETLLKEGHAAHFVPDMHGDDQRDYSDVIFEYRDNEYGEVVEWLAKINELEVQ